MHQRSQKDEDRTWYGNLRGSDGSWNTRTACGRFGQVRVAFGRSREVGEWYEYLVKILRIWAHMTKVPTREMMRGSVVRRISSVNPDAEHIMCTFLALVVELDQLLAIIPEEDTPFLDKEVWCHDWSKFFGDNFSSCQKEAKEKGVTLPMSGKIAAKGNACVAALPKVQDAVCAMKEEAAKQAKAKATEEERVRLAEEEWKRLASEEAARNVAKEETTAPDEEEKESSEEEEEGEDGDAEASGDRQVACRPNLRRQSGTLSGALAASGRIPPALVWRARAANRARERTSEGKKAVAATLAPVAGPFRPAAVPVAWAISISEDDHVAPRLVARGSKRKAVEALEEEVETLDEVDEALQKQFEVMEAKCVQAEGIVREMWIGMDLIARMITKRCRMHK
ncbi:uncharacterized protein EDB93DRAFT_1100026 [Suillus bovinus]|uniref:uncharacterized protein n=1 Tax=Suillus bovinus TaxID=48563 RepID=UPI001B875894|nr:uncharacterized protein EDB93DRAFT_1100026 [Suillus bovinus]KAG2158963.1 hypothetical protein EDB93DRAFT_1100026 [Suillus bovinus]